MRRLLAVRVLGPLAVVLFPFLTLAADHGIPDGTWWDSATDVPVLATIAVGVGALAYGVQRILAAPSEAREDLRRDLERLARRAFVPVNVHLPGVPIGRLGVHVWATRGDRLGRLIKYTMDYPRAETPVAWRRGTGVMGLAWQQRVCVAADLRPLYELADRLSPADFDALPAEQRYGMTHAEVMRGTQYQAILAYPLSDARQKVIGVLSVDSAVPVGQDALLALRDDHEFQDVLGACEIALRGYVER